MVAPPPELIEDVIEQILLRLPPDEPAYLVRASLVCKLWCRIVLSDDIAFLRRYRCFHRTPPLLGFFDGVHHSSNFVPIAAALPFPRAAFDLRSWNVMDCRHGRVFLHPRHIDHNYVWDPITDEREQVRDLWFDSVAVVLYATAGCDHGDCHGGPFHVVSACVNPMQDLAEARVYSSQAGAWGTPASISLDIVGVDQFCDHVRLHSGVLVGDEVYFVLFLDGDDMILKYDLSRHCLSMIDLPDLGSNNVVLMRTDNGLLGLASARDSSVYLWSRTVNGEGVAAWVQCRVMELQMVLPVTAPINRAKVIGFAEGVNVIFVSTDVSTFIVDLKSGVARKVRGAIDTSLNIVTFVSFCTPANCRCQRKQISHY